MNRFSKTILNSIKTFLKDDPMTYAASLAFYTVISLPAILLISINIMSAAYEKDQIKQDLLAQLNYYLGPNTFNQAETILNNAQIEYSGLLPQIIGWVVLFVSATTVFISLQNGINKIWGVRVESSNGIVKLVIDRILSFAMLVSVGFVMLVSLVIDSILILFNNWIENLLGLGNSSVIWIANGLLSVGATSLVFAFIFKFLPDVKISWSNVCPGAVFTSILFLLGKYIIGFYISTSDIGNAYGASGSLVVFLSWVYYSSILVLFGAKFTFEYTNLSENFIEATDHSVFVEEVVIAENKANTR